MEILGPDVTGDHAVVEAVARFEVKTGAELDRLPCKRPGEVRGHIRIDAVVVPILPAGRHLYPGDRPGCRAVVGGHGEVHEDRLPAD